ncbi:MAG TPA: hypothetical protein VFR78_01890 [Pyrinomonadaceae bacterium]|nr:hypothetical protein [Pyrinomonadaceae bacterium]
MNSFSQRKGLKPIKNIVQVDSMDRDLRNGLWNALQIFYWGKGDGIYKVAESISAVESLCNLITGGKDTLGDALKKVEARVAIHPALKKGFGNIYGYTSDANGIRHALLDEPDLDF